MHSAATITAKQIKMLGNDILYYARVVCIDSKSSNG